jgi:exoribonuclease R
MLTEPILTPDAASRHIKPGAKVVVELTQYPDRGQRAQGVISEVLGKAGEKDVDLKTVMVQFNLRRSSRRRCGTRPAKRSTRSTPTASGSGGST